MGYRSDVAIAIPKKVYEENLKIALASSDEEKESKYFLLLNPDILINNKESYFTVLAFYDVKWYNDIFEDVIYIEDIIKNLDETEHYAFIRCGEGINDYEETFHEGTVKLENESVYDLFHLRYECQLVIDAHKTGD